MAAPSTSSSVDRGPSVSEVRSKMPDDCRRRSTRTALAIFAVTTGLYLLLVAAIVLVPFWPLRLLFSLAAAFMTGVLFVVGHDACHGAFVLSRGLNAVLGRIALFPSWHPYAGWEHAHNHVHHAWTNLRGKDYAWSPKSKDEYDRMSRFGRFRERVYRSGLGFGFYYFFDVYLKKTIWPGRSFRGKTNMRRLAADDALVVGFVVLQAAFIAMVLRWLRPEDSLLQVLFFAQLLPMVAFNFLIGFLTFFHHTHPRIPWFDNVDEWTFYTGQICGTAHVMFPGPINWLIQNIMEHAAHHADPKVPLYRLAEAQAALERAYPEDAFVHNFSWRSFRYTMRTCQLYDYNNHCWMSFTGEVTSSSTMPTRKIGDPVVA